VLDQHALDQAIDGLAPADLQQQAEQALLPVIEALQKSRDETEVLGLLAETSPDLDATALQALLAKLIFMANLWGRLSAAADRED
jgi:phage gp29-like protein